MNRSVHTQWLLPRVVPPRPTDETLLSIAIEGCVSETWVAMMAQIQAERVETPELRALFTTIPQARSAEHLACLKT